MREAPFAAGHAPRQRSTQPCYGGGLIQTLHERSLRPGFGVSTHVQRRPPKPVRARGGTATKKTALPPAVASGGTTVSVANSTAAPDKLLTLETSTASPAPSAYTSAALLARYTGKRNIVQKAAELSKRMHFQVQDVAQMEEEQRLLSQAYRGRQKILEQPQQLLQQAQVNQRGTCGFNDDETGGEKVTSKTRGDISGDSSSKTDDPSHPASPGNTTEASPNDMNKPALPSDAHTGLVFAGTLNIKNYLQQEAEEKRDTLMKMRGIQQLILELSEGGTTDEGRRLAQQSDSTSLKEAEGVSQTPADDDVSDSAKDDNANGHPPSSAEKKNVDMIQELRSTLKEMLNVNHASLAPQYSTIGGRVVCSISATKLLGSTWIEQDATYRPLEPLQMFSTNAFALTLEYLSNSIACIAHIADEVCVATTLRSRTDPVLLLPYLESLQKWVAQADRCLETTQRHLRHFQSGEAALIEGGAYEVNSLREQTLLLRESLTAHEQKVKAAEEAKISVLNRFCEVIRRCYLWEVYLLHRSDTAHSDGVSWLSSSLERIGSEAALTHLSYPSVKMLGSTLVRSGSNVDAAGMMTPNDSFSMSFPYTTVSPACADAGLTASTMEEAFAPTKAIASRPSSRFRNPRSGSAHNSRFRSNAASKLLATSSKQTPFQQTISIHACGLQPLTSSSLQLLEQRVARSWCNPYARKKYLCQCAQQQTEQQQLGERSAEKNQSMFRMGAAVSEDLVNSAHNPASEAAPAPTSRRTSPVSFNLAHSDPSACAVTDATATAGDATGGDSLTRLGLNTDISHNSFVSEAKCRARRAIDLISGSVAGSTAIFSEPVTDMADVRTLQLLQSLQRTIPSKADALPRNSAKNTERRETNVGSDDVMPNPSLPQPHYTDVTQDEEQCAATWDSIQQLSRYLTTCTTRLTSHQPSTVHK
ncbi:hypothetical protein, conserved [Leishmania tarentolae]|uniref:Uncharacterized protein n=1 Tax=Leishmania tarentolae TaxID=5689 RepID=A0A640KPB4_LEITA|nr:hypothetical protein, conserved [Leishmania tarentolae]